MVALGDVATLQRGYDLPVQDRVPGEIPVFAANGSVGSHNARKVDGPGVVTGRSGSIGKVHHVDGAYWPLNTSLYVKDFHGNDTRYVYYLLRQMKLEQYCTGTGVPTLNRNVIHAVEVPVPPITEQRRIAAILDHADALRAKRREALARLDELTQSIFADMFGDPGRNPMDWDTALLAELVADGDKINYGVVQPGSEVEGGVPLVRAGDITDGKVDRSALRTIATDVDDQHRRSRLMGDEVLVSCVGSIGEVALASPELKGCNIARAVARVRVGGALRREYLAACLSTPAIREYFVRELRTVAQPTLNIKQIEETQVPVPPLEIQDSFVTRAARVATLKAGHRAALAELDSLFASLQSRAFRGEL